jgi:NADH-quinone oxidoreductase subunit G
VVGVGSPRASLEANFALQTLVGPDRFFQGVSAREKRLVDTVLELMRSSNTPTLHEIEQADAVLVLGEDAPNTAPRLALALRQTAGVVPRRAADAAHIPRWHDQAVRALIQDAKTPIYLATPIATRIDALARRTLHAPPEDLARLGFSVAHLLGAPGEVAPESAALAEEIAAVLRAAEHPVVVTGTSCGSEAVLRAAAQVAWACGAGLFCVVPECNSLGLALLGGGSLDEAARALGDGDTLVVVENDLYAHLPSAEADDLLARAGHVVVVDHLAHATGARAHTLLPAGTFAESDGTFVNNEGRAQRFFQVFVPEGQSIRESWRWLRDVMATEWNGLDDVIAALVAARPDLAGVRDAAPSAAWRFAGTKVARQTHRASGRTAMTAQRTVHEPRTVPDPDAPLRFSMEGAGVELPLPAALVPRFWSPGWNSEQALHRFQEEIEGPLRGGTPGVRLISPRAGAEPPWWRDPPGPFRRREGEWRIVPLFHVFGSEPLSMLSPGVAERAPAPYVALAPADAEALGVASGQAVTVDGIARTLPVRVVPELTPGTAGLPVGLLGPLPSAAEVKRA